MEWPIWKAWYRFWASAFGAVVAVLALDAMVEYGAARLRSRGHSYRLDHPDLAPAGGSLSTSDRIERLASEQTPVV
jgi:hypothetical protein